MGARGYSNFHTAKGECLKQQAPASRADGAPRSGPPALPAHRAPKQEPIEHEELHTRCQQTTGARRGAIVATMVEPPPIADDDEPVLSHATKLLVAVAVFVLGVLLGQPSRRGSCRLIPLPELIESGSLR
jgi:hypothetical protein